MKKSQLQDLIKEAISEILNELTIVTPTTQPGEIGDIAKAENIPDQVVTQALQAAKKSNKPVKVAEDELKGKGVVTLEEDRGIRYKLTDDYEDKIAELPYANSEKRMKWVNGIIEYLDEIGAADITKIAREKFGLPQPRIADYARDMIRLGILEPEQEGVTPQFMRPETGEEDGEEGIEGGIEGDMSDERVDAGFPNARVSDEEEPDESELEKTNIAAGGMSDADYEDFMKYTDLEKRLASVKSDILKASKLVPKKPGLRKTSPIGDIDDTSSNEKELQNLRDLKIRLQAKMDDLLAGSEYLQKRREKMTGKKYEPITTPEEDEEDQMNEWMKGRMQYYAGIKK